MLRILISTPNCFDEIFCVFAQSLSKWLMRCWQRSQVQISEIVFVPCQSEAPLQSILTQQYLEPRVQYRHPLSAVNYRPLGLGNRHDVEAENNNHNCS